MRLVRRVIMTATKTRSIEKPQIITRPHPPIEVCFQCGAINPFRQSRGVRHYAAFDVAPAKCRKCGALAQIRTVHGR